MIKIFLAGATGAIAFLPARSCTRVTQTHEHLLLERTDFERRIFEKLGVQRRIRFLATRSIQLS